MRNPDSAERLGPVPSRDDSNAELHQLGSRQMSLWSRGRCGVRRGSVTVISSQMKVSLGHRVTARPRRISAGSGGAMRSGTPSSHQKKRKKKKKKVPFGRHFFLPDRAVKSAGRSWGGSGGLEVPVTHKANRNEKHCRWKRTRGGDGDAGSMGGGWG